MVLGYSTSYFLGNKWSESPLYAEKIIPLLDTVLSNNYQYSDKMSSAFFELINKYQNTAELPTENIKEFIKENGQEYILNLLNPDDERIKILVYLMPLIRLFKGTKKGIQIVLSLFQLNEEPQDSVITDWYETLPVGVENTFSIDSGLDISGAGDNFFNNFSNFIKHYVYPELTLLKVRYSVNCNIVQEPYVTYNIHYSSNGTMQF
jgi:hypothetical protein